MSDNYRPGGFRKFSMFPPVIKSLIIINLGLWLVQEFFGYLHVGEISFLNYIQDYLYLHPTEGPTGGFYIWQLVTYQFFHGSFWHLFFNLFALWMFGAELESLWGSRKFLVFYLISGIGGGLFQLLLTPYLSDVPWIALGASGSIFGVLIAFGLTFPNRPIFMFPIFIPIPAKFFVMGYAAFNIISSLSTTPGSGDNTAYLAHIGGFVFGFLLFKYGDRIGIYRFFDKLGGGKPAQSYYSSSSGNREPYSNVYQAQWETPKARRVEEDRKPAHSPINVNGEEITQAKIDDILDKISQTGYQNLTDREKQILFELSQKLK